MTMRILIVEDEVLIAMDLEMQVMSLGHEVIGLAPDLATCQRLAAPNPPDLALMDLRLAGGDSGIDAAKWLLDEFGVRSIFISGNLDEAVRGQLSADLDPIAFIGKPIFPHQLEAALAEVPPRE